MATVEADSRRDQLVATAAETLVDRGMEATRFKDVAEHAGVSIGLLQHYFGSRDELIELAIEHVVTEKFSRLAAAGEGGADPWGMICEAIDEVLLTEDPIRDARSWLDLCAAGGKRERVGAAVSKVQDRWIALIADAVAAGEADGSFEPGMAAVEAARSINAMIDGMELALSAEAGRSRHDADEVAAITKRAAWRIVGGVGEPPASG